MITFRTFSTISFIALLFSTIMFVQLSSAQDSDLVGEPEMIADGFQFTEGPYWHPNGFLIFSDIPASIIYKWSQESGEAEPWVEPSGNSNGISAMPDGQILVAQHAGRVSQINDDLELEPIAEEYDGKRLNSPNDIAVRSDGLIYFTDPPFGVSDEDRELDFSGVFRIDPDGSLTLVYDGFSLPNGLVFTPDESHFYINESETGDILRFEVDEHGDLSSPELFANVGPMGELGGADGMVTDSDGRLYTTGPNGFIVFDNEGNRIHHFQFEHQITNMTWGGEEKTDLYITAPDRVYRLTTSAQGWY